MEFKYYYDACLEAASRTRNSIYLFVAILVSIFSIYFNTQQLRFSARRVEKMSYCYACIQHHSLTPKQIEALDDGNPCKAPLLWASKDGLPTTYAPTPNAIWDKKDVLDLYKERLNIFTGKKVDLKTITIPLFGNVLDIEDLGLISGIMFVIIMIIIRANMNREIDAFEAAKSSLAAIKKSSANEQGSQDLEIYKGSLDLLSMVQVLASHRKDNAFTRWAIIFVFLCAPIAHGLICKTNVDNSSNTKFLTDGYQYYSLIIFEFGLLIWIAGLAFANSRYWYRLVNILSEELNAFPELGKH